MFHAFIIILLTAAAFFIIVPISVLFHELGHAIAVILLTRKKVFIYIGSFGDPDKSLNVKLGLFDFWVTHNPLLWKRGLCVPSAKGISINRRIIFTVCGPLASLVLGILACYFIFQEKGRELIILFLTALSATTIISFLNSIIPDIKPKQLHNGKAVYNDGGQIKRLLRLKKFPSEYLKAVALHDKKEFEAASVLFDDAIKKMEHEDIFRFAFGSNIMAKKYSRASEIYEKLKLAAKLTSDDYCNHGMLKGYQNLKEESLQSFHQSLALNPNNYFSLNNRGYFLNTWQQYNDALADLDKAILLKPGLYYAYCNRGFSKIKSGAEDDGLADIYHSLTIEPNNSYAYYNFGFYYVDKGNKAEALRCCAKAKELDKNTHLLDDLVERANAL